MRSICRLLDTLLLSLLIFVLCGAETVVADELVTYRSHVSKVLKKHCVGCHNSNRSRAGLDLSSYATIVGGSDGGDYVVAGDAADSFLYLVAAHEEEPAMPPSGKRIPDRDLLILKQWIEGGLLEDKTSEPLVAYSPAEMQASTEMKKSVPEAVTSTNSETNVTTPTTPTLQLGPVFHGLHGTANKALAVNAKRKLVAVGAQLQVLLFDTESFQIVGVMPFPEGEPQVLRFSSDGTRLLAGGGVHAQSGRVVLWDTALGQRIWEGGDEFDVVMAADLSPDGKYVVLGGPERIIKIISVESGELVHRIEKHTDWVLTARFGAEGLVFATADRDGGVYLWETQSGKLIHSLRGHKGAVYSIAWQPGKDVCITGSEDGTIRAWDLHTGKQISQKTAHTDGVLGMSTLPAGNLVSIGRDEFCKVWSSSEAMSLEMTMSKELPLLPINVAAIDEGSWVVSSDDGGLAVWNFADDKVAQLQIPENLLTKNISEVIPASFASVQTTKREELAVMEQAKPSSPPRIDLADSKLLTKATKLEKRLRNASETIPKMVDQVGSLRARIGKLEAARSKIEMRLNKKLAELESAEAELQTLISELDQMFEVTE